MKLNKRTSKKQSNNKNQRTKRLLKIEKRKEIIK